MNTPPPSQADADAVELIERALRSTVTLQGIWEAEEEMLEEDDRVVVQLGEPDHELLGRMAEEFESRFQQPFPGLLRHLLARVNGIAAFSQGPSDEPSSLVCPGRELSEPALWPAMAYGDHLILCGADLDERLSFYVIGEIADSGFVCLGVAEGGEKDHTPVFWVDREISLVRPLELFPDLGSFLRAFADAAFSLPILLRRQAVPGWGR